MSISYNNPVQYNAATRTATFNAPPSAGNTLGLNSLGGVPISTVSINGASATAAPQTGSLDAQGNGGDYSVNFTGGRYGRSDAPVPGLFTGFRYSDYAGQQTVNLTQPGITGRDMTIDVRDRVKNADGRFLYTSDMNAKADTINIGNQPDMHLTVEGNQNDVLKFTGKASDYKVSAPTPDPLFGSQRMMTTYTNKLTGQVVVDNRADVTATGLDQSKLAKVVFAGDLPPAPVLATPAPKTV